MLSFFPLLFVTDCIKLKKVAQYTCCEYKPQFKKEPMALINSLVSVFAKRRVVTAHMVEIMDVDTR